MSQFAGRMSTPGAASRKRKDRDAFYKPSVEEVSSNRLLAGYLAHEFLTKGTLLGQRFDPARAEVAAEAKKWKKVAEGQSAPAAREQESYAEVASILKAYGTHIAGIVNPTELARWIKK